jgi:hypothetical protein
MELQTRARRASGAIEPKAAICSGRAMRYGLVHYIDLIFVIILMVTFYM